METSTNSQLPEFEVTRFHLFTEEGSYDMLEVKCPRCKRPHWVPLSWRLLRPVVGREDDPPAYPIGRNCPNCSKVSAIPERWRGSTNRKERRNGPKRGRKVTLRRSKVPR